MNPTVSVIILNYNGLVFLEDCLNAVFDSTYKDIEVIVADNASTDGSVEFLKHYPNIKLIETQKNFGFGGGNNIAAKNAQGKFLLFLNNDTKMFPDMIEKLINSYEDNSILAAFLILMSSKDQTGCAGNGTDIFGYPYGAPTFEKTKVFYADGSGLFIKKNDFFNLGMFDDALFMFQEDIDLSWRARLFGFKIKSCLDAKYYHYSGGTAVGGSLRKGNHITSIFRRENVEKNNLRNLIKNYSFPTLIIILPILLMFHLLEILVLLISNKTNLVKVYLNAYAWNLSNLRDTLKWRSTIQKRRVVSDPKIMQHMTFTYSKIISLFRVGGIPKIK